MVVLIVAYVFSDILHWFSLLNIKNPTLYKVSGAIEDCLIYAFPNQVGMIVPLVDRSAIIGTMPGLTLGILHEVVFLMLSVPLMFNWSNQLEKLQSRYGMAASVLVYFVTSIALFAIVAFIVFRV